MLFNVFTTVFLLSMNRLFRLPTCSRKVRSLGFFSAPRYSLICFGEDSALALYRHSNTGTLTDTQSSIELNEPLPKSFLEFKLSPTAESTRGTAFSHTRTYTEQPAPSVVASLSEHAALQRHSSAPGVTLLLVSISASVAVSLGVVLLLLKPSAPLPPRFKAASVPTPSSSYQLLRWVKSNASVLVLIGSAGLVVGCAYIFVSKFHYYSKVLIVIAKRIKKTSVELVVSTLTGARSYVQSTFQGFLRPDLQSTRQLQELKSRYLHDARVAQFILICKRLYLKAKQYNILVDGIAVSKNLNNSYMYTGPKTIQIFCDVAEILEFEILKQVAQKLNYSAKSNSQSEFTAFCNLPVASASDSLVLNIDTLREELYANSDCFSNCTACNETRLESFLLKALTSPATAPVITLGVIAMVNFLGPTLNRQLRSFCAEVALEVSNPHPTAVTAVLHNARKVLVRGIVEPTAYLLRPAIWVVKHTLPLKKLSNHFLSRRTSIALLKNKLLTSHLTTHLPILRSLVTRLPESYLEVYQGTVVTLFDLVFAWRFNPYVTHFTNKLQIAIYTRIMIRRVAHLQSSVECRNLYLDLEEERQEFCRNANVTCD